MKKFLIIYIPFLILLTTIAYRYNQSLIKQSQVEETLNLDNAEKDDTNLIVIENTTEDEVTLSSPEDMTVVDTKPEVEENKEPEAKLSLVSYVRKLKRKENTKNDYYISITNEVYGEDVIGEPKMCFTVYKENEKTTYQYYFLNNNEAVKWIKENGEKDRTYTMLDIDDKYERTMKASYDDGKWKVGMVGEWGSISLDEYAKGIIPTPKKPITTSDNNNKSCSLDEFLEMYDTEFDDDLDAEDWWYDYGCESPN